ncbi:MAG: hypothetical protein U0794_08115 [Isosphaeraceae bacterium]
MTTARPRTATALPTDLVSKTRSPDRDTTQPDAGMPYVEWLLRTLRVATARIDDCDRREAALRLYRAQRASVCWDLDRELAVEQLAASLRRRPGLTVAGLRRTRHGCEWLMARWESLRALAMLPEGWDERQTALAHQLLGLDDVLLVPGLPPWQALGSPLALAEAELSHLRSLHTTLVAIDTGERALAERGVEVEPDRMMAALQRERTTAWKTMLWARNALDDAALDLDADTEPDDAGMSAEPTPADLDSTEGNSQPATPDRSEVGPRPSTEALAGQSRPVSPCNGRLDAAPRAAETPVGCDRAPEHSPDSSCDGSRVASHAPGCRSSGNGSGTSDRWTRVGPGVDDGSNGRSRLIEAFVPGKSDPGRS